MLKVKVIAAQCIGAASCVAIAPNTFQLNDQNISEVQSKDGSALDSDDNVIAAAKACPVNAIIVVDVDEQGNEKQLWPPL